MRKAMLITAAVLVVALVATPVVWARQHMKDEEQSPLMMLEKLRQLRDELNLTESQRTKLREIGKETRQANKEYRAALRDNFVDAGLILVKNPDDIPAATAALDRNEAAKKDLRANVLEGVSKAIKVLTPEQRSILQQKLEHRASEQ
jgi:Spy/CpxP family protein refolding chaperone